MVPTASCDRPAAMCVGQELSVRLCAAPLAHGCCCCCCGRHSCCGMQLQCHVHPILSMQPLYYCMFRVGTAGLALWCTGWHICSLCMQVVQVSTQDCCFLAPSASMPATKT